MSIKELNKKLKEIQNETINKIGYIRGVISDVEDVKYFCCKSEKLDFNLKEFKLSFNIDNGLVDKFINMMEVKRPRIKINRIDKQETISTIYID